MSLSEVSIDNYDYCSKRLRELKTLRTPNLPKISWQFEITTDGVIFYDLFCPVSDRYPISTVHAALVQLLSSFVRICKDSRTEAHVCFSYGMKSFASASGREISKSGLKTNLLKRTSSGDHIDLKYLGKEGERCKVASLLKRVNHGKI